MNKSWFLRYQLRRKKMGLGGATTFSVEESRQRARRAHQLLADKIDSLEARRAEQAKQAALDARNKSFEAVTREYVNANVRRDLLASFKHASALNPLPMRAVD